MRWVGRDVTKRDAVDKSTGQARYYSDLHLKNMLYGRVLRANRAHARIKRIDTSRAQALKGVVAVLTHKDVQGTNRYGIVTPDQPVLCEDKVRYEGDAVALVAAEDPETAERALDLIGVEYEPLPVVSDPIEAIKPDSPRVHEAGNVYRHARIRNGDIESAFKKCAVVVENTYRTGRQMHMFLETEAGVGFLDESDNVVLQAGGQAPYRDQLQIARALGIPREKIRVVSSIVGGAFGGKDEVTVQIQLALLALRTRRPVKMVLSREESGISGLKRHPVIVTMKTGALPDGKLLANQVKIVSDTGAYASLGGTILDVSMETCCGPYVIPNIDIDGYCVYTNNGFSGAFRGFGAPQVQFAMESQMEMIAERLQIDRLEIRKRNVIHNGEVSTFGVKIPGSIGIDQTLDVAAKSDLWSGREALKSKPSEPWCKRGVGIACSVKGFTFGALPDFGSASITLNEDGTFTVGVSCPDLGQGNVTAYAQIAAEELRCRFEDVRIDSADTRLAPDTGGSSASRSLYVGGNAVVKVAQQMRELLLSHGSQMLGDATNKLECRDGTVMVVGRLERKVTYASIAAHARTHGSQRRVEVGFEVPRFERPIEGSIEIPHWSFMYATAVALVEVDTLTGSTKVIRFLIVPDVGKVISPQNLKGQCEGAVVQGLGYALMEDAIIENGQLKTPNFTTYLIPTIKDAPEIDVVPVETYEKTGPFGAKGAGEIAIVPVAAAISNAIYDASGVRSFTLPMTAERVFNALRAKRTS
ncbi:MAG TPA: xanthine dehydrogenase family protein molybdopterin-binding subunit [Candidatus Acidoferrum sp.]|nr:xanthine dehydrogenase family protein molybdopterin-binding subunit [Candidatus Acidoferrum sp.]